MNDREMRAEMDRMLQACLELEIDLICTYADAVKRGTYEPDQGVILAISRAIDRAGGIWRNEGNAPDPAPEPGAMAGRADARAAL